MNNLTGIAKKWVNGLSVYQPGKPIEEVARELGLGDPESIIKLASNENALGPSPKAIEAMKKFTARMHIYPDGDNFDLRKALAKKLKVADQEIFIGHGSNEIIQLLGHVFLDRDSSIVVSDHAFIVYRLVAALYESSVISVPMKNFTHDLTAMNKAIRSDTRMVFISNPNNPTGTMVDHHEIDSFMKDVPDHTVVIFDEAYIELLPPERQPDTLRYVRENRNVYVLRTFSKTYGLAGLRVGYALAPREGISLLHRVRQPFNVNAMAQTAAQAALQDEAFVEHTRTTIEAGMRQVCAAFEKLGLSYIPSVANFVLVKVGNGQKVYEALQKLRVIVRPVNVYQLPEYVRVTIGTEKENSKLIEAFNSVMTGRECQV